MATEQHKAQLEKKRAERKEKDSEILLQKSEK
jgi:hypothetical protein